MVTTKFSFPYKKTKVLVNRFQELRAAKRFARDQEKKYEDFIVKLWKIRGRDVTSLIKYLRTGGEHSDDFFTIDFK